MHFAPKFFGLLVFSVLLCGVYAYAQESAETAPVAQPAKDASEKDQTNTAPADPEEKASNPAVSPVASTPWQAAGRSQTTAPDVYLLPDEFGKLRKVLGFRYEDFFQAWNRHNDVVAPTPRYAIEAVKTSGEVLETHARLQIEIQVAVQSDDWVDVPILLPNLIVQKLVIANQIPGECLVFDKKQRGYVVWLSGKSGKQRKLILDGLTKLKVTTGSTGIEVFVPRAADSKCTLKVPGANLRFEDSSEQIITPVVQQTGDFTNVSVLGYASPLRLNWSSVEKTETVNQTTLIEVAGKTNVLIDREEIRYEIMMEVDSLGSTAQQVQVRLPRDAKLNTEKLLEDYEVESVVDPAGQGTRQVVTIRRSDLPQTQSPTDVWKLRLAAEQSLDVSTGWKECPVDGFEVLGASQQSGTVTVEVNDRLQAYADIEGNITRVPLKATATTPAGRSILGEFRYARFPWRLTAYTSPRQRRVSVTPKYDLTINSQEALLDLEYKYEWTGAEVFVLRIKHNGWSLVDNAPIESDGLISRDGIMTTRDDHLRFRIAKSDAQQLPLKMRLRKDIQLGKNVLLLPKPIVKVVVDGELVVNSADAIRVTPTADEIVGLSLAASSGSESEPLESSDRDARAIDQIRFRTFLSEPQFVAQIEQKQREVSAELTTEVEVAQQQTRVRQQLDYQSRYQPVSQLSLDIPNQVWLNDTLTISLGGDKLPLSLSTYLGEEPEDEAPDESTRDGTFLRQVVVSLPRSMQNAIPLEVSYEITSPEFSEEEPTSINVPLISPVDEVLSHNAQVSVTAPLVIATNQRSSFEQWAVIPTEDSATDTTTTLELQANENALSLDFYAQIDSVDAPALQTTLERAWIQSWFTPKAQQQRAVFRFRTTHDAVFAQLPFALTEPEIEVLLDGQQSEFELLDENRLAISLPPNGQLSSHTLELRYQQPSKLPTWGKLQNALPQLECRAASALIYWQLIMPRGWLTTTAPEQLSADYWLGWKNYRWGRQPTLSQTDLEQITRAVTARPPSPLATQYVYRAFELPVEIEVVAIRRAWLFVACAALSFAVGLLCLYTTVARNGVFWLTLSVALLIGIFSYPEVTLLVIQAILIGGVMTFAASILRRTLSANEEPFSSNLDQQKEPSTQTTDMRQLSAQGSDSIQTTATLHTGGPLP